MKLIRNHPALFTYFIGVVLLACGAANIKKAMAVLGLGTVVGSVCVALVDPKAKKAVTDVLDSPDHGCGPL